VVEAAAHASVEKVSRDDARDVLDFADGISEYVFVLSAQFDRFRKRQSKEQKSAKAGGKELKIVLPPRE